MNRVKLHTMVYFIAAAFFVIGCVNYFGAADDGDYEVVSGYVTDVEKTSELTKGGHRPAYNYTVVWSGDDGQQEYHFHKMINPPDETQTTFWAQKDGDKVCVADPTLGKNESCKDFIVAIGCAVLGYILSLREKKQKYKH